MLYINNKKVAVVDNHIVLTQAEYDALPSTEKLDPHKTYFIKDGGMPYSLASATSVIGDVSLLSEYGADTLVDAIEMVEQATNGSKFSVNENDDIEVTVIERNVVERNSTTNLSDIENVLGNLDNIKNVLNDDESVSIVEFLSKVLGNVKDWNVDINETDDIEVEYLR